MLDGNLAEPPYDSGEESDEEDGVMLNVLLVVISYASLSTDEVYALSFLFEKFPQEVLPSWAARQSNWWLWERGQSPTEMFWEKGAFTTYAPDNLPGMSWFP